MNSADAAEYLSKLGLSLPETLVNAIVLRIESIDQCLDQYTPDVKALIQYHLLGLLSISFGARRVKSQSAPSGASQSYDYGTLVDQFRSLRGSLFLLDSDGCTAGMVPPEPGGQAAMYVVKGRRKNA